MATQQHQSADAEEFLRALMGGTDTVKVAAAVAAASATPYGDVAGAAVAATVHVGAAATTDLINLSVTADAVSRFVANADGKLEWGGGALAVDTNLYRSTQSSLKTDGALVAGTDIVARPALTGNVFVGAVGPAGQGGIAGGATNDARIYRMAADLFATDGGWQLKEHADFAAPATDFAVVYAKDNGSGKTQLVVRFPTGSVQVIATEP